jgi:hypothetical protein
MYMPISDFFNKPQPQMMRTTTPSTISSMYKPTYNPVKKKTITPEMVTTGLRHLESSGGMDPNTPRNQKRSYTTVPANQNEQARTINYDVGYGGEYGLTPIALASLAGSTVDRQADPSTFTKYGRPLIPGMTPEKIQEELKTPEGAGRLATQFFMSKRLNREDFTPESLANDYIDLYVGKGGPSDTPANRKRALDYFNSLIQ